MLHNFCSMGVGQDDGLLHTAISTPLGETMASELPLRTQDSINQLAKVHQADQVQFARIYYLLALGLQ